MSSVTWRISWMTRVDVGCSDKNSIWQLGANVHCVCVVIPFILDVRLVDAPAGVTQTGGNVTQDFSTFLLRCLP